VYGLVKSGKTVFNEYLAKAYDHHLIDFNVFITKIKEMKAGPEGDAESIVVTPEILCEELKILLKTIPFNKKICIDNIINSVLTQTSQIELLFNILGTPRFFFNLVCHEIPLKDRYLKLIMGKEEGGEMSPEETEEWTKVQDIHTQIINLFKEKAYKTVNVNTNYSVEKSLKGFDANFGRNFIVIKHEYDINIEKTLLLLATTYKALYVNVPALIYKQFYLNNNWAERLEKNYNKKRLLNHDTEEKSLDYQIYYKYNPIR
jgi:hypothetical protein